MTIEKFLEDSSYGWANAGKTEELKQAYADSYKMDPKAWVDKWAPVIMDTPKLTEAFYDSKLLNATKPLAERISTAFGTSDKENPFRKSDKWVNQLYHSEFSDVPRETFDAALKNMGDYWEDEVKQREYESGKKRREKEVKEEWTLTKSPARALLASDYEKQRYIEDPESAIFGKEAGEGPIWTKPEATSDLIFGVSGAVGDAIPGIGGVLLGPAARTARDVYHKATDSPYQAETGDIIASTLGDMTVSGGIQYLPNLRQYTRMFKNAQKSVSEAGARKAAEDAISGGSKGGSILETMALEDEADAIIKGAKGIDDIMYSGLPAGERKAALRKYWNNMPESQLKSDLNPVLFSGPDVDLDAVYRTYSERDRTARRMKQPSYRDILSKGEQIRRSAPRPYAADDLFVVEELLKYGKNPDQTLGEVKEYVWRNMEDSPVRTKLMQVLNQEKPSLRDVQMIIRGNKGPQEVASDIAEILKGSGNLGAVIEYAKGMPDNEMSRKLIEVASSGSPYAVRDIKSILRNASMPEVTAFDPFTRRFLGVGELTRGQQVAKNTLRGLEKATSTDAGNAALKELATAQIVGLPGLGKRPKSDVKTDPQAQVDWYKNNYARDFEMGFKPAAKEGDPKWEAYRQWYYDKTGKMPESGSTRDSWVFTETEVKGE